ncbi:MAG: tetratricopeptide repeat protein [Candidatus Aminicenantes bacterium]|nr:tetratricopeptide repeat protein [Candidatus Aminicenantes bacterium]
MKGWFIFVLLLCWIPAQVQAAEEDDLLRGMVYFLADDHSMARLFVERHFRNHPNPQVRQGYMLLLDGKSWDATRRFSSYLEINHRSAKALVGIGLATRNTKNSNSQENFERAVRLHPRFFTGYICLGKHYQKDRNHERALANYRAALTGSKVAEVKILLAGLHVQMGRPDLAEALVREEADAHPDNFHFNYMTALALVNSGRIDPAGRYIQTAIEIQPDHRELVILKARYLYRKEKLAEARSLLSGLDVPDFHKQYLKIYSRVLIALKEDRRARPMLYRLFRELPWDVDVNLLMGQFVHAFDSGNSELRTHWMRRAMLAGASREDVLSLLPGNPVNDPPSAIPFFSVRAMTWPTADYLVLVGKRSSGASEQLFVVDAKKTRVAATFGYNGHFHGFHRFIKGGGVFFSTTQIGGDRTFLYQLDLDQRGIRSRLLTPEPLPLPAIILESNAEGSLIFVTDSRLEQLAFSSPFSVTSQLGHKTPLYPECPFPVLMLNRRLGRWTQLKSEQMLDAVPIPSWTRYRLVRRAARQSPAVEKLIQRGMEFDISSPEIVRIVISPDKQTLLLYLADLENAFQAVIYNASTGDTVHCDQSMFLSGKSFADVDVAGIDPYRHRILLVTRDKDREAILFQYHSRLYVSLGKGVLDTRIVPGWRRLYLLREMGNRMHAVETRLDSVNIRPFLVRNLTPRGNLTRLVGANAQGEVEACTYDGERVRICAQDNAQVEYLGVSLEGALHLFSPDRRFRAAFINGRLILLPFTGG